MVDQANMSRTNGAAQSPPNTVAKNMGEVLHDIVALVELQAELFKIDIRESITRLAFPAVLVLAGTAIAVGTIPVALLMFMEILVAAGGLPYWLALLAAAVLGFGLATILLIVGWRVLKKPFEAFRRSQDELKRNIDWIKRTLAGRET